MNILHWEINPELKKEAEEHYRTNFAIGLKDKEPLEIIRQMTFDRVAPDIGVKDIENLFDFVEKKFLKNRIKGIGVEVGAGPATFSSVLTKRKSVEKIYAVEVCQPIVELLMPKIARYILGDRENKVVGAVGSFDDIELSNESVDFVFDFFSLHHSNNLVITLKECFRVLKKDGFIFCFDKARPDYFNEEGLDELLDAEYTEKDKILFGWPPDKKFTRRMNGEKEYRLKDWLSAFKKSEFSKIESFYLAKVSGRSQMAITAKKVISGMPKSTQLFLDRFLPKPKQNHKFILDNKNRIFSEFINPFPKEISLLIAYR